MPRTREGEPSRGHFAEVVTRRGSEATRPWRFAYHRAVDPPESPREAFFAARRASDVKATLAALERWLAPEVLNDEGLLELLVVLEAPEFAGRKSQARLEVVLARAVWRAACDPQRVSRELLVLVLERWQASGEYGPQTACDVAGRLLMRDPGDAHALEMYVAASVADAYAHRGTSLEDIAERTDDPRIRGRLLLAGAFVDYVVFRERVRGAERVQRALAADPSLAYEALREQVLRWMGLAEVEDAERDAALPPRDGW